MKVLADTLIAAEHTRAKLARHRSDRDGTGQPSITTAALDLPLRQATGVYGATQGVYTLRRGPQRNRVATI